MSAVTDRNPFSQPNINEDVAPKKSLCQRLLPIIAKVVAVACIIVGVCALIIGALALPITPLSGVISMIVGAASIAWGIKLWRDAHKYSDR